jgi:hypothetical protein
VHVEGSVQGGDGEQSGAIGCVTNLGPVAIDGDLLGGSNTNSGTILAGQLIARVEIGGAMKESRMELRVWAPHPSKAQVKSAQSLFTATFSAVMLTIPRKSSANQSTWSKSTVTWNRAVA